MNRIAKYSFHWIAAAALILAASCTKTPDEGYTTYGEGEGCVELSIALDQTRSADNSALDNSVLKIYDCDDRLVRRYEPATEMPESIYILAGDYTATLLVGNQSSVTTDSSQISYSGECEFEVTELATSQIVLNCPMLNSVVDVAFDTTIDESLQQGYTLRMVAVVEGESYSEESYGASDAIKMEQTESGATYFIIPDGYNLAWQFEGVKESTTGETTSVVGSGTIAKPVAGKKYSLTFKYTTYLEVTSLLLDVDTSTDDFDDSMEFTPQPIITPLNFELGTSYLPNQDFTLSIVGLNTLSEVEIVAGETTISPLVGGSVVGVEGATYTKSDDMNGVLTLSPSLFGNYAFGGEQVATVKVTDIVDASRTTTMAISTTGITSLSNPNYWTNVATISAVVVDEAASVVTIEYRNVGATDWYSATATKGEGNTYSIETAADWSAGSNSVATIYTLAFGISPANSYEARVTVDGKSQPTATLVTDDSGCQTILDGSVPNGLSCYGENTSSSSSSWCSGNNSYALAPLCSYGAYGGEACAYLASTTAAGKFAAGNIVYGQFNFASFTGTMSFGQAFAWTSRPKSLKVRYGAVVNTMSSSYTSSYLSEGDTDPARIYIAIVDWSSRHEVEAGSSGSSNTWNPEGQTKTDEGNIIGYGSAYISKSTESSTLEDLEIDILYYDTVTKPSKSISIVISCAASAYGDYFSGSTGNRLWVKDFELGY
ncbi:MAG: PCMD domain-containing protein [Rikenellaceae bacterium]